MSSVAQSRIESGIAFHDYGAFGEGPSPGGESVQRFVGLERDGETFLDYMGARYYRNVNGRFNSVDPGHANASLTRPQSWNAYAYASNNPLRYVDPTGLSDSPIADGKDFGRDLRIADMQSMTGGLEAFNGWANGLMEEYGRATAAALSARAFRQKLTCSCYRRLATCFRSWSGYRREGRSRRTWLTYTTTLGLRRGPSKLGLMLRLQWGEATRKGCSGYCRTASQVSISHLCSSQMKR